VFEKPKRPVSRDDVDDVNDVDEDADNYEAVDEDVRAFSRRNCREIGSPNVTPYLYKRRFLDKLYGIRRDGDTFMIGKAAIRLMKPVILP
jgi:hypothetical protein